MSRDTPIWDRGPPGGIGPPIWDGPFHKGSGFLPLFGQRWPLSAINDSTDTTAAWSLECQAMLTAYEGWHGGFRAFCDHVQRELRVPWGRDAIAKVLELHGVRLPRRRRGKSPDELALRGAFQTFFPSAQWVGDGMSVPIGIGGGEQIVLNFELQCDAFSGAFMGLSIRDRRLHVACLLRKHPGPNLFGHIGEEGGKQP